MRSLPIDAAATGAGLELVVVLPGPGQERRVDRRLRDFVEHVVAAKAAREWLQVERAKSPQYFHELRVGTCLAHKIAVYDEAACERHFTELFALLERAFAADGVVGLLT